MRVPLTIHTIGDMIRSYHPVLMFFSETRSTSQLVEKLKQKWNLHGLAVDKVGKSGGLAMFWQKSAQVSLRSLSRNHIDVEIQLEHTTFTWRVTGIYGHPEHQQRYRTWELIQHLHHQSQLPWIVGGDFNEILDSAEKCGGLPRGPNMINSFRDALNMCNLSDLGYEGTPFTWSNNRREPYTVRCRLDRVCGNSEWMLHYPLARVKHLDFAGSDHLPILLELEGNRDNSSHRRRRPFRFEAIWVRKEECEDLVRSNWTEHAGGDPIEDIIKNVDKCKIAFTNWGKSSATNPKKRIAEIHKKLSGLRERAQTEATVQEQRSLREELEQKYGDLDMYWRQRSRVQWIREGDRNTSFFHAKASTRHRINRVHKIKDKLGNWKEERGEIEQVVSSYFEEMFQSTNPDDRVMESVLEHIEPRVSSAAFQFLSLPFSADEVTRAISQMAPLKSPGPDGLPVFFFTKYWHVLGSSVIDCVLRFLNNRVLPAPLNFTYIVLIPKVKCPEKMSEYRPISLCNVIYKFGSKVIANRIKPVLGDIISSTQSAFVPKRLITDNILVAYEVNHFIRSNHRKRSKFMAIKLDISKAYDRIEWCFLRYILMRFGFPPTLIELIMLCVSTVSYAFLFNGSQFGRLRPKRGLRQVDPLSPYLFICCTEALIAMLHRATTSGEIQGVRIAPNAPVISNLCFADDTLIFCQATPGGALNLRRILDSYALASGQVINLDKSTMSFCPSSTREERDTIVNIIGFHEVEKHDKYLGMPTSMGKSRKEVFGFLRDRIWSKIKGWGEKKLSSAGKEILIKAVLQAIPSYVMGCFLMPQSLITELEGAIRKYWWGNGQDHKMAWMAWHQLCKSKESGGLGFRDLRCFNLALLAKQLWRILTQPDSLLSRLMSAKYFPEGNMWAASLGTRPSATWRSFLSAREWLKQGLRIRIGDGRSTSIWCDPWLVEDGAFTIITKRSASSSFPNTVADLIDPSTHSWDLNLIQQHFWPVDHHRILAVPIGSAQTTDKVIWHYSPTGLFSVKSCYRLIFAGFSRKRDSPSSSGHAKDVWMKFWQLQIPPKIRMFVWRAYSNILPTNAELHRRHISSSPYCPNCRLVPETCMHVMVKCRGMNEVWANPPFSLSIPDVEPMLGEWLHQLQDKLSPSMLLIAIVICWKSWDNRNKELHGEEPLLSENLLSWAYAFMETFKQAQLNPPPTRSASHSITWTPPPSGRVKINYDAAIPPHTDGFVIAAVARDTAGTCIGWKVVAYSGKPKAVECAHALANKLNTACTEGVILPPHLADYA